jgi:hypothetical protein
MRRLATCIFGLFALLATATTAPADDTPKKDEGKDRLVGTWKLASAKYGGQPFAFPEDFTTLKVVTPGRYVVVIYNKEGKVARAAGGRYTLDGDKYEETPEFSTTENFDAIKGKPQTFKCRLDGDKWHHNGTMTSGMVVEEVWERADKK